MVDKGVTAGIMKASWMSVGSDSGGIQVGIMKGQGTTMRTALMMLAVCAGFATAAPAVQSQDYTSLQCLLSDDLLQMRSDIIWAFG